MVLDSEMTYDNTNRGALFENDKKGNEKAPDFKGTINVDGIEFYASAWKRDKYGKEYFSISIQPKEIQSGLPKTVDQIAPSGEDIF